MNHRGIRTWGGLYLAGLLLAACDTAPAAPTATALVRPTIAPNATTGPATPVPVLRFATTAPGGGLHPRTIAPPSGLVTPGTLTIGTEAGYPPMEFKNADGVAIGADIDIAAEIANRLGLTLVIRDTPFDNLLSDLSDHRFDLVIASLSVTESRQRVALFVPYHASGQAVLVKKGNPQGIKTLDDLAGRTVAIQQSTAAERMLKDLNERLRTGGKPAVTVLPFDTTPKAVDALRSGRADAMAHGLETAAYEAYQAPDAFEIAVSNLQPDTVGLAISKLTPDLLPPIQQAVTAMQADGTLPGILRHWKLVPDAGPAATPGPTGTP